MTNFEEEYRELRNILGFDDPHVRNWLTDFVSKSRLGYRETEKVREVLLKEYSYWKLVGEKLPVKMNDVAKPRMNAIRDVAGALSIDLTPNTEEEKQK